MFFVRCDLGNQRLMHFQRERDRNNGRAEEQQRSGDVDRRRPGQYFQRFHYRDLSPVIIKAFGAASIPLNGSTILTFTIQNNNTRPR